MLEVENTTESLKGLVGMHQKVNVCDIKGLVSEFQMVIGIGMVICVKRRRGRQLKISGKN